MKRLVLLFTACLLALAVAAITVKYLAYWQIANEKAMVSFTLKAHNENLTGNFKAATGSVVFDADNLQKFKAVCDVPVKTINTGIAERDEHLQAKDWFDAGGYPTMHFEATTVEKTSSGFLAKGSLMAKGKTIAVSIPFSFQSADERTGIFKASFTIKRSDFGIGEKDDEIADEVIINLELPVSRVD